MSEVSDKFNAGEFVTMEAVQDIFFRGFSDRMMPFKRKQLDALRASNCYIASMDGFKKTIKKETNGQIRP